MLKNSQITERLRTTNVALEEQKSNVQQLTDEVGNRNSRVLRLEADKFFIAGDLHEKCIVKEDLRQKCMQLQLKLDKLTKLEKELSATTSVDTFLSQTGYKCEIDLFARIT